MSITGEEGVRRSRRACRCATSPARSTVRSAPFRRSTRANEPAAAAHRRLAAGSGVSFAVWESGEYFGAGKSRTVTAPRTKRPHRIKRCAARRLLRRWCDDAEDVGRLLQRTRDRIAHRRSALCPTASAARESRRTAAADRRPYGDEAQPRMGHRACSPGVRAEMLQDFGQVFNDPHLLARNYLPTCRTRRWVRSGSTVRRSLLRDARAHASRGPLLAKTRGGAARDRTLGR